MQRDGINAAMSNSNRSKPTGGELAASLVTGFRSKAYRWVGRALLLNHSDPRALPTHYVPIEHPLEEVYSQVHYDPHPSATNVSKFRRALPFPAFYRFVATTQIGESFVAARNQHGGSYDKFPTAILCGLGGAGLMATLLSQEQSDAVVAAGRYHSLLGDNPAGLDTTIGIFDIATGAVYTPGGAVSPGEVTPIAKFALQESIF